MTAGLAAIRWRKATIAGQNEILRVAGRQYEYIVKRMKDFKTGTRPNDAGNMTPASRGP